MLIPDLYQPKAPSSTPLSFPAKKVSKFDMQR